MSLQATKTTAWKSLRSAIATADWPTTAGVDPDATPGTERLASKMLDNDDAALPYIARYLDMGINKVDMRWSFSTAGATATVAVWGCRGEEPGVDAPVKKLGSVALTAGTQCDAAGRYFAASGVWTSCFKASWLDDDVEAGTGMYTAALDVIGYAKIWFVVEAISAGNITCDWASY